MALAPRSDRWRNLPIEGVFAQLDQLDPGIGPDEAIQSDQHLRNSRDFELDARHPDTPGNVLRHG